MEPTPNPDFPPRDHIAFTAETERDVLQLQVSELTEALTAARQKRDATLADCNAAIAECRRALRSAKEDLVRAERAAKALRRVYG